jgi:excisionase family DNA binding protein
MTDARTSSDRMGTAATAVVEVRGVTLDEPLLDCQAAAELLNVRISWVRDAARLGQLPCLRVGRHLRFTRLMLQEWLAEQIAVRPAAPRAYPKPVADRGGRSGRRALRPRTQTALLASVAETANAKSKEIDDDR